MFLDHDKYAQTVGDDLSGVTALSKSLLFIKTLSVPDCGIGADGLQILASTLAASPQREWSRWT